MILYYKNLKLKTILEFIKIDYKAIDMEGSYVKFRIDYDI